jgi:sterol desaturase/sphingolipid hydroxylase (fatty acid hydroxylase superfamily)
MTEAEFQIVKGVAFVAALALALGLQRVLPYAAMRASWRVNGALWGVNLVVMGVVCGGCACAVSRWAAAEGVGLLNATALPSAVGIALSILALDFVSWFWHRANHVLRPLWRFHQVHHSDATFTATTALRFHPGELLLSLPVRLAAVVALGVPVIAVIVFEICFAFSNFVEHGNIRLPQRFEAALARILVTPALHRRHHGRRREELSTNFGTIFSVWDRLLGTYGESSSQARYRIGLPGSPAPVGPVGALLLPRRAAPRGE